MVTVPLGISAYKRAYAGEPEVRLENRFVEKSPSNLREHIALLARPGTSFLVEADGGNIRGLYSKPGLFNGDLFIVSGANFWRCSPAGVLTAITGTIDGTGNPYIGWMKGIGYEILFISDGAQFQYYTTHAMGTLTLTLSAVDGNITNQVIDINGKYYSWSATVDPATTPDGTSAHPYLALLGTADPTTGTTADSLSLANMVMLLNYSGIPGYNFSSSVPGFNGDVSATSTDTTLVVTARTDGSAGNSVTTTIFSGSLLAWGHATLQGGGNQALNLISLPNAGESPLAVASVSSYVLVSVAQTQKAYFLNPGEVTIDPLNYFEKESNPDNIVDMHAVGDQVVISGNGSTENWYATGDINAPFAPQLGRVYRRGALTGTPVVVRDSVILVGDDGVVYEIGYQFGQEAQWGVKRVSTNGIEERIRTQIRRMQGLPP